MSFLNKALNLAVESKSPVLFFFLRPHFYPLHLYHICEVLLQNAEDEEQRLDHFCTTFFRNYSVKEMYSM